MQRAKILFTALCFVAAHGYLGHGGPVRRSAPHKANVSPNSLPTASIPTASSTLNANDRLRGSRQPRLEMPSMLPVLSYASLASATAGALHLLTPLGWQGVALVGYSVGVPTAMVLAQLVVFGGSGVAKAMGGQQTDDPHLKRLAHEAAAAVGVAPPNVYEIKSREPNAFATSSLGSRDATVAVTTGLREILTDDELGAVLAHEMGHLRHRDVMRNMHVAAAAAGLGGIYEVGRMLLESSSRRERRESKKDKDKDGDSGASLGLALMAGGALTQGAAHGLRLMASRGAELKADRAAAEAYGVDAMVSALRKIHDHAARRPADLRASAAGQRFAFAMISDGTAPAAASAAARADGGDEPGVWGKLGRAVGKLGEALRTHPTLEKRVEALEQAAAAGLAPQRRPGAWW